MNKLKFADISDQQLVDVRTQHGFQAGHIEGSLNLNPGNFKKYAEYYLEKDKPLVIITDDDNQIEELGFTQIEGYLLIEDVPEDELQTTEVIPTEEFLNTDGDYILLDVRHPDEITRPAPETNLVTIPFEDLKEGYEALDASKEIYTLCGSGNRSTAAASFLESKGLKPIVIEGGMKAVQEIQNK